MRIGRFGELGGSYVAKPLKKCLTITGHPLFKSEFLGVLYFFIVFRLSRIYPMKHELNDSYLCKHGLVSLKDLWVRFHHPRWLA